jgi:hypothetical protein
MCGLNIFLYCKKVVDPTWAIFGENLHETHGTFLPWFEGFEKQTKLMLTFATRTLSKYINLVMDVDTRTEMYCSLHTSRWYEPCVASSTNLDLLGDANEEDDNGGAPTGISADPTVEKSNSSLH